MTRFCGRIDWADAGRGAADWWPSMLTLLGDGAVDCSPVQYPDVRLGFWSPGRRSPSTGSLASDGDVLVLFSGYLHDPAVSIHGEAHAVLTRYRSGDWSWLRSANGVFAFAVVDRRNDRCVLAVDRLGIRPLFFAEDAAGLAFGEDLAAVTAQRQSGLELDYDVLQEMEALGFPLGTRTFLRSAERVGPGTRIELSRGGRRVTRYWSLEMLPPVKPQEEAVFLDESRARLRGALGRLLSRSRSRTLCLLSSGYDSRRLLLEAHALGAGLDAVTSIWPYPRLERTTIEPAVTSELCRRLGIPHRLVELPATGGAIEPRQARMVRDTLLDFQVFGPHHIWALPLIASLEPTDDVVNLDGLAGDTFFNNPFYSLPRALWGRWRPDDELLDAIVRDRDSWDRRFGGLVSRSLSSRLRDALAALPEGPTRLSFFYLLGRTRAVIALLPYGLLNLKVESLCPYLDNEVMEHALTFDPIVKGERRLQGRALARHFPELGDIPSSHSEPAEIPRAYVRPMGFSGLDFTGTFAVTELALLLRSRLLPPHVPRVGPKDLAFVGSDTLRLSWPGGRWRESRIWNLIHSARIVRLFGRGNVRTLLQERAAARASMEALSRASSGHGHPH